MTDYVDPAPSGGPEAAAPGGRASGRRADASWPGAGRAPRCGWRSP